LKVRSKILPWLWPGKLTSVNGQRPKAEIMWSITHSAFLGCEESNSQRPLRRGQPLVRTASSKPHSEVTRACPIHSPQLKVHESPVVGEDSNKLLARGEVTPGNQPERVRVGEALNQ